MGGNPAKGLEILWGMALSLLTLLGRVKVVEKSRLNRAATFRAITLILPQRLCEEDLGDAIEEISRLERAGAGRWQIRLIIASTHFWLLLNALREITSGLIGAAPSKK
jgi:hypothetical protein